MKKNIVLMLISLLCSAFCFSQSADRVSDLISEKQVTYGQASYFCASALGLVKDSATYDESVVILMQNGILPGSVKTDDKITMQNLASMCASTWNIEGSFMLKFFNNSRYAFRHLKTEGIIPENYDPDKIPSGRDLLNTITACIENYEIKTFESEEGKK